MPVACAVLGRPAGARFADCAETMRRRASVDVGRCPPAGKERLQEGWRLPAAPMHRTNIPGWPRQAAGSSPPPLLPTVKLQSRLVALLRPPCSLHWRLPACQPHGLLAVQHHPPSHPPSARPTQHPPTPPLPAAAAYVCVHPSRCLFASKKEQHRCVVKSARAMTRRLIWKDRGCRADIQLGGYRRGTGG